VKKIRKGQKKRMKMSRERGERTRGIAWRQKNERKESRGGEKGEDRVGSTSA
jgi:hypothetical protein